MRDVSRKALIASVAVGLVAALSGCSAVKSALGVDKKSPDEFAIVTKAPLVIPPDFALRPPQPGAPDSQVLSPSQAAEQTVFGRDPREETPSAGQSQGELALLEAAGAEHADPAIRNLVAAENKSAEKTDESLTDRLMFWKGPQEDKAVTLDSAAEAERIRQSEAAGTPVADPAVAKADGAQSGAAEKRGGFFSHLWPF